MESKLLPLRYYPDPVLRVACNEVTPSHADSIDLGKLADHMRYTMHFHKGAGLASPQIGLSIMMFVTRSHAFINPKLHSPLGYTLEKEGCLSIPRVRGYVESSHRLKISALNVNFKPIEVTATDFEARVWQHEVDHLHGKLFIDIMAMQDQANAQPILKELDKEWMPAHADKVAERFKK